MTEAWAEFEKYEKGLIEQGFGRGKTAGKAEGQAEAVLSVLRARGIPVSAADEHRIRSCPDVNQLSRWLVLAVSATSADQVFADVDAC